MINTGDDVASWRWLNMHDWLQQDEMLDGTFTNLWQVNELPQTCCLKYLTSTTCLSLGCYTDDTEKCSVKCN